MKNYWYWELPLVSLYIRVLGARDPKSTLNTASQLLRYKDTIYSARSGNMIPQYYWVIIDQILLNNLSGKNHWESV